MGPGLASRKIALGLLRAVLRRGRPLDEALVEAPGLAALEPRDRAFARLLTATTLRRLGQIDDLIDGALERPLKAKLADLRDVVRLGVCQIVFLETPPHAAVDTSVALAAQRFAGHRGLVNAVLRRIAREAAAGATRAADGEAARRNTPAWLWTSLLAAYGEATARAIAEAHLGEPPLDLTLKNPGEAGHWAARLGAAVLPTGSLRLVRGGEVQRLEGYEEGAWWVQDTAASLPARLLGEVHGRRVIDLCAAPGGKTAQLAAAGAEVIAVDRDDRRLKLVADNLERLSLAAALVHADAVAWRPPEPAAAVLLDAPCSATGTLRRHPDIAHLKTPEAVARLVEIQDTLLRSAAGMLAAGGRLVVATCSLLPEEGPERIAALLAGDGALERVPITPAEVGGLAELVTPEGDVRTLPCHLADEGGMDGFYICRLRRR